MKIEQIENSRSEKQSTQPLVAQKLQEELQLSEKADEKLLHLFKVLRHSANNLHNKTDDAADQSGLSDQSYDIKDDLITKLFKKLTGLTTDVLILSEDKSGQRIKDESR